jgi:hypothetical protein
MNTNPHQSLLDVPKDILFKVIEVCEPDSLYSMYLVNKSFQQIIEDMKLLSLFIYSVKDSDMCRDSWKDPESSIKDFLSHHHKFLQEIKHYKLRFLTHQEVLLYAFNYPQLISMINMLEIYVNICYPDRSLQILEQVHRFPNITMLSLVNIFITSVNFSKICFKSTTLRYLKLRDGILSSRMDFSLYSFVKFSLENMNCQNETSIIMPDCLKKCDLSCYQTMNELLSNCFTEFHMSHCKKLNTL